MNSDASPASFAPESASERFVDAALSEHARLGREGADEELILRILQETVHRRRASDRAVARFGREWLGREWRSAAVAVGAAAALVALALVALSSLRVDAPGERRSDELRFVVRTEAPAAAKASDAEPARIAGAPRAAHRIDFELVAGPAPGESADALRRETIRITADRGVASAGGFAYEGSVLVELAAIRIEAASVRLPAPGEEVLLADRVRVTRADPACVAEAERLSFDPVTGRIVLTGVSRVETDKGLLAHFSPSDRLVLSGGGFSVESGPLER